MASVAQKVWQCSFFWSWLWRLPFFVPRCLGHGLPSKMEEASRCGGQWVHMGPKLLLKFAEPRVFFWSLWLGCVAGHFAGSRFGCQRAYAKASLCLNIPCVQASGESTVQKEPSEVPVTSQTSQISRSGFRHVLLNLFALPNDAYDASNGFRGSPFIQRMWR